MADWLNIPETNYKISRNGEIKNPKNKILKNTKSGCGYYYCRINNISKRVHRLVAITYIPNPNNYPEVDHIDRNKENNNVDNLRWVSYSQNCHNKPRRNQITGQPNIYVVKNGKYQVTIKKENIMYNKNFDNLNDAIIWRNNKREELNIPPI